MSADAREALAAAASAVPGVDCHPYFRQSTRPGDAMVRMDRIAYPDKFGGVVTWQVAVVLPQDLAAAERYMDEKVPALVGALSTEMRVTDVIPQQLVLDSGAVPIVLIQGAREQEEN